MLIAEFGLIEGFQNEKLIKSLFSPIEILLLCCVKDSTDSFSVSSSQYGSYLVSVTYCLF